MFKVWFAALAVMLSACSNTLLSSPPPFPLSGSTWQRTDDPDAGPHFPTIVFREDSASGFAGCNTWSANITGNVRTLHFGPVATTRIMCPPSSMDTESKFLPILQRTRNYRVEGHELILTDADNAVVARFGCADADCPQSVTAPR
jgi:heat shock protein HslJ